MPVDRTPASRDLHRPRDAAVSQAGAVGMSGRQTAIGAGHRYRPRAVGAEGCDGDSYLFAVLEGLYSTWFNRLDTLARLDGLTGIANRREFDRCLAIAWETAFRRREPLALIMIDVDHFKAFNDRYGHLAGDDCLREIAHAIERTMSRPGYLAARYGGEEFVVVLPATDAAGARAVAGAIRRAIRNVAIRHDDGIGSGLVTVSLGIAVCAPLSELQQDDLIRIADEALYAAKRAGRDRLVLVEERSCRIRCG